MLPERVRAHRGAEGGRRTDDETDLDLDVELRARAEPRSAAGLVRPRLATWTYDGSTADDHGARAPVVAHRQPPPVRRERVAVRPEDPADVGGVVDRRVKVDVVRDS